jgi:hypothetical protein
MKKMILVFALIAAVAILTAAPSAGGQNGRFAGGDPHGRIYGLAATLAEQAAGIARESFDHFKGWNGAISDQEQAILFKSESFVSSCRLFLKFAEGQSDFYRTDYLRTSLYNAFTYLTASFSELEQEMRRGNVMPYALSDCRKILGNMEREFSGWPSADNLAYLDGKYVKSADASVYLIQRQGMGQYIRRPFKSLESLFRYNFNENRGKDPWKYLVEVSEATLRKMPTGAMIALTFEGQMIIEQGTRPNRPVYKIENGRKRGLTKPEIVNRLGGWGRVFEVPREVIESYEEGEPIDRS